MFKPSPILQLVVVSLLSFVVLSDIAPAQDPTIEKIVLSGEVAPDTGGEIFASFLFATVSGVDEGLLAQPSLNDNGEVAFPAALVLSVGITSESNVGVWAGGIGTLAGIIREGDAAPGTPFQVVFGRDTATDAGFFTKPVINDASGVAFNASLVGPGVDSFNDFGQWAVDDSGVLQLAAREGDPATGTVKDFSGAIRQPPAYNDAGHVATSWSLRPAPFVSGYFLGEAGALDLLTVEGGPAPDTAAETLAGGVNQPALNANGDVAFTQRLTGGDTGLWTGGVGALTLGVRSGIAAPGTGGAFGFIGRPGFNDSGEVYFEADVTGVGNRGLFAGFPNALDLVALPGDPAPDAGAGVTFVEVSPIALGGGGDVTFWGEVEGPGVDELNNEGLWAGPPGSIALIARKGDAAPGTPAGVTFESFKSGGAINGDGNIAFGAFLEGAGIDETNDEGLWAQSPNGVLTLIAREGDDILVGPGDSRTIKLLSVTFARTNAEAPNGGVFSTDPESSGNQDGRLSGFNEWGQMAFLAQFSDESEGIFLATFPDPGDGDADDDGIPDEQDTEQVEEPIAELPNEVFGGRGQQNAALSILANIEDLIAAGDIRQAIRKLTSLRRRVDGCGATPDRNDWIEDCDSQIAVRDAIDTLVANLGG